MYTKKLYGGYNKFLEDERKRFDKDNVRLLHFATIFNFFIEGKTNINDLVKMYKQLKTTLGFKAFKELLKKKNNKLFIEGKQEIFKTGIKKSCIVENMKKNVSIKKVQVLLHEACLFFYLINRKIFNVNKNYPYLINNWINNNIDSTKYLSSKEDKEMLKSIIIKIVTYINYFKQHPDNYLKTKKNKSQTQQIRTQLYRRKYLGRPNSNSNSNSNSNGNGNGNSNTNIGNNSNSNINSNSNSNNSTKTKKKKKSEKNRKYIYIPNRIGIAIAGNSMMPGGYLYREYNKDKLRKVNDNYYTTQEENILQNMIISTGEYGKIQFERLLNKEGREIKPIYGAINLGRSKSVKTIQGIDYTKAKPKHYKDCWVLDNVLLSNNQRKETNCKSHSKVYKTCFVPNKNKKFKGSLFFSSGPCLNYGPTSESTMRRTFNEGIYKLIDRDPAKAKTRFLDSIKYVLRAQLDAMIINKINIALIAKVSMGIYKEELKSKINDNDFYRCLYTVLNEKVTKEGHERFKYFYYVYVPELSYNGTKLKINKSLNPTVIENMSQYDTKLDHTIKNKDKESDISKLIESNHIFPLHNKTLRELFRKINYKIIGGTLSLGYKLFYESEIKIDNDLIQIPILKKTTPETVPNRFIDTIIKHIINRFNELIDMLSDNKELNIYIQSNTLFSFYDTGRFIEEKYVGTHGHYLCVGNEDEWRVDANNDNKNNLHKILDYIDLRVNDLKYKFQRRVHFIDDIKLVKKDSSNDIIVYGCNSKIWLIEQPGFFSIVTNPSNFTDNLLPDEESPELIEIKRELEGVIKEDKIFLEEQHKHYTILTPPNKSKPNNKDWTYEENEGGGNCFYYAVLLAFHRRYSFVDNLPLQQDDYSHAKLSPDLLRKFKECVQKHPDNKLLMDPKYMKEGVWAEDPVIQACANYLNVNIWISLIKGSDISWKGKSKISIPFDQWVIYRPGNTTILIVDNEIISDTENEKSMIQIGSKLQLDISYYEDPIQKKNPYQGEQLDNFRSKIKNPKEKDSPLYAYSIIENECNDTNSIYIQNLNNTHFIALDHVGFKDRVAMDKTVRKTNKVFEC